MASVSNFSDTMGEASYENGSAFEWQQDLYDNLSEIFGHRAFLPGQEKAINAAMAGLDVILRLRTGGGKSLAFWLPALMQRGVTIVIEPLVAVMEDQVAALQHVLGEELQGAVTMIQSSDTPAMKEAVMAHLRRIAQGEFTQPAPPFILYVTPERISQKEFQEVLIKLQEAHALDSCAPGQAALLRLILVTIARIVIDEAHCIYDCIDFRHEYGSLKLLAKRIPLTPMTFASATMPSFMRDDIVHEFALGGISKGPDFVPGKAVWVAGSPLFRPNHQIQVVYTGKQTCAQTATIFANEYQKSYLGQHGLVFCLTQKDTLKAVKALRKSALPAHISIQHYHAKMPDAEKTLFMQDFKAGRIHIACATTGCGLGIDVPHVQFTAYLTLPVTFRLFGHPLSADMNCSIRLLASFKGSVGFVRLRHSYCPMTGVLSPSGHDGPAPCILYYRVQDISRITGIVFGKRNENEHAAPVASETQPRMVAQMARYALDRESCRHAYLRHLDAEELSSDDNFRPCESCDNCIRLLGSQVYKNVTREAWHILKTLEKLKSAHRSVTPGQLGQLVRGKRLTTLNPNLVEFVSDDASRLDLTEEDFGLILLRLFGQGYVWMKPSMLHCGSRPRCFAYVQIGKRGYDLVAQSQEDALESGEHASLVIPADASTTAAKRKYNRRRSDEVPSASARSRSHRNERVYADYSTEYPSRRPVSCPLCGRAVCRLGLLAGHIGRANCKGHTSDKLAVLHHQLCRARLPGVSKSVFDFASRLASKRLRNGHRAELPAPASERYETARHDAITEEAVRHQGQSRSIMDHVSDGSVFARPTQGLRISDRNTFPESDTDVDVTEEQTGRNHAVTSVNRKQAPAQIFDAVEVNAPRKSVLKRRQITPTNLNIRTHLRSKDSRRRIRQPARCRLCLKMFVRASNLALHWKQKGCTGRREDILAARNAYLRLYRDGSPPGMWQKLDAFTRRLARARLVKESERAMSRSMTPEYESDARPSPVLNRPVALSSKKRKAPRDAESEDAGEADGAEYSESVAYKRRRSDGNAVRAKLPRAARPGPSSLVELEFAGSWLRDSSPEV